MLVLRRVHVVSESIRHAPELRFIDSYNRAISHWTAAFPIWLQNPEVPFYVQLWEYSSIRAARNSLSAMSKGHGKSLKRLPRLRVFILGAGVSAACGIPVTRDIFRAMMLRLLRTEDPGADEVHKLLRYLYPSFDVKLKN